MNYLVGRLGYIIIVILIVVHSYFFIKTMTIADSLLKIEREIRQLEIENAELEKKLYSMDSIQRLTHIAPLIGFTGKARVLYE